MCRLIKWANYKEDEILKMDLHTIIKRYNWFKKDQEEEEKREAQNKPICPLVNNKKRSKK